MVYLCGWWDAAEPAVTRSLGHNIASSTSSLIASGFEVAACSMSAVGGGPS